MENPIVEKTKGKNKTDRERQTYYRVAFKNNCNLLQIADNKANIIITINSLAISSCIAFLGYGSVSNLIQLDSFVTIAPILVFLSIILVSTMLAVQAAKPSIIGANPAKEDRSKSSLLFFGESSKYVLLDYLEATKKLLGDKDSIHEQMSISLYFQGKVLDKKYRLIRRAYEIFVLGLAFGILIFLAYLIF